MEIIEIKNELFDEYKKLFPSIEIVENKYVNKFSSVEEEYKLLKHGVAVRDLTHYSKIFIHGKDSESLLKRLSTNKIVDLKVLEWAKTLFVNSYGNIIDRTLLLKFEDYFILIGSSVKSGMLLKWIERFVINDDITLKDSADNYSLFEILGSQAGSFISMILGDKYSELNDRAIIRVKVEDFFVHGMRVTDVNKIEKFVLLVESKYAVKILKVLENMKSVYDFGMIGEAAYNFFRIENGIPIAPNELNDDVNPMEVNLLSEVSQEKDDFIGHDLLENNYENMGRLVKIVFNSPVLNNSESMNIFNEENMEVGIVTSFSNQPMAEKPIGLGFILNNIEIENHSFHILANTSKVNIELQKL